MSKSRDSGLNEAVSIGAMNSLPSDKNLSLKNAQFIATKVSKPQRFLWNS